jgi:hypothetical protein
MIAGRAARCPDQILQNPDIPGASEPSRNGESGGDYSRFPPRRSREDLPVATRAGLNWRSTGDEDQHGQVEARPCSSDERKMTMAVMVRFTLKTDKATYQSLHTQMLALAIPAGLLFHSGREVGGQIGIVDFWASAEAWRAFSEGPLAQGMKSANVLPPDDLEITPVINASGR